MLTWTAVDSRETIDLPHPWPQLRDSGRLSPLLHERVRCFAINEHRRGRLHHWGNFLTDLGRSYLPQAFDPQRFLIPEGQVDIMEMQQQSLKAITELAEEWDGLIPAILWDTLAAVSTRPDPGEEDSILNMGDLPHEWYICDAGNHALGITYALNFHVQSRLVACCGRMIVHGCGCNHYMPPLEQGSITYEVPTERRGKVAKEFLNHLLGCVVLIAVEGYPFVLNSEELQSPQVMRVGTAVPV